jgi:alpha-1,2-mannosyltransferase
VLWQLVVAGWRPTVRLVAGVVAGTAVVWLPFLLLAPGPMLRMVVADQLGRPQMAVTTAERLESILNLQPHLEQAPPGLGDIVLAVTLALVLAAAAAAWSRRGARVVVLLLAVTAAVVLVGPSYFLHYATFPAPFLAVVVGVAVGVVLARLRRPLALTGAVAVLAVTALAAVTPLSTPLNDAFPGARLGQLAVGKGCVIADDPNAIILMDALSRDLARGCPQPVDFTGSTYDVARERRADGSPVPRRANRTWQRLATRQLTAGDATIVVRLQGDGLNTATLRRLQALPIIGEVDGYVLRGR